MWNRRFIRFSFIVLGMLGAGRLPAVQVATPVSPGAAEQLASVGSVCPTFSWGAVDHAQSYELVVYAVAASGEAGDSLSSDTEPRLRHRLPGGATSWTPSLDVCFEPGGRYAWVVRAISAEEQGAWSEARLFQVAAGPTRQELAEALALVERYLVDSGNAASTSVRDAARDATTPGTGPIAAGINPVPAAATLAGAVAAIRGELSDTTGEAVGVLGVSNSPDGAGILAANTDISGADLVLDGSAQSLPDTSLTESGILVGGSAFEIGNPTDDLSLTLDGIPVVTTATDKDSLSGLTCSSNEIARWDGAAWMCASDDDTDTLATLVCATGEVAKWDGAIWICASDDGTEIIAGNQLALTGTTLDVVDGTGSGLDADLLDGQNSANFAGSVHDHFGETWSGATTFAFRVENSLPSGSAFGLWGQTDSTSGHGVIGKATAGTGSARGVFGQSSSNAGIGVFGEVGAISGTTSGVHGQSASTSGRGVYGKATATSGVTARGVYGESASDGGQGVFGQATASSGPNYGVRGESNSTAGSGVFGWAVNTSGTNYGVLGQSRSLDGYAGSFENTSTSSGGTGLYARGSSGDAADIVLGGNDSTEAGDDGRISSDPDFASSDIFLDSNDEVVVRLDRDNDESGSFQVLDGSGAAVFDVDESGDVRVNGTVVHGSGGGGPLIDADLLDGMDSLDFATVTHPHAGEDITSGVVAEPRIDSLIARDAEIIPAVLAGDGTGSGLDADLLDGQNSGDFAGSVHDHYGETWSGTAVRGLKIETNHSVGGARGILGVYSGLGLGNAGVGGLATATSGTIYGVSGESWSTSGRGVFGLGSASSGIAIGVEGESLSTSGRGVFGRAITTFGMTYGVYGQSASQGGRGVFGEALATVGAAYGVHGMSASTSGRGVFGEAAATTGTTYGVYGQSASSEGRGVFGWATGVPETTTYGVYGQSDSRTGRGVYGLATGSPVGSLFGITYGVYGESSSTKGRGVFGEATASSGTTYGVRGESASTSGRGVLGEALSTSGTTYGVYGVSNSSTGYGGYFENEDLTSNGGVGLYARGSLGAAADIVLGGNSSSASGDDGRIWSDPSFTGSDIFLEAGDGVIVHLDRDGGSAGTFEVWRQDGTAVFKVDESGNVEVNGTVVHSSDRDIKENFSAVESGAILEAVAAMPIQRWNFIDDEEDTPHLGPMAQDFYAAFGLGTDERHIATVDADGIALAAIQGLHVLVEQQQGLIQELQERLAALENQ